MTRSAGELTLPRVFTPAEQCALRLLERGPHAYGDLFAAMPGTREQRALALQSLAGAGLVRVNDEDLYELRQIVQTGGAR